jgi:hypothetical protein
MTPFIRTSISDDTITTYDAHFFCTIDQRVQISSPNGVIEILWHPSSSRVCIYMPNNIFFLTNPSIDKLSLRDVFKSLGYDKDIITLEWSEDNELNHNSLLDEYIENFPISQMRVHKIN